MSAPQVREHAYAKLNLVLQAGRPRPDGLHPICSVFASIDLADEVYAAPAASGADSVECPGVEGRNLAEDALASFRERVPALPPVAVRIVKRIPVAAGLGGGSADTAAVLRATNRIAGDPLDAQALRAIAAPLGSDVPSQVEPRHALVRGTGEIVEPVELPPLAAVLVPQDEGLSTAAVYAELDRMEGWRERLGIEGWVVRPDIEGWRERLDSEGWAERLDIEGWRERPDLERPQALLGGLPELAAALENDLQPAALSLRPELGWVLERLRNEGALGALVSGSGPTCFGLFDDRRAAGAAAATIPGALVTALRDV